jgi:hypothetical protein
MDLSNISVEPSLVAEEIRLIKMSYFSTVAEQMLDDTLRSMSMLNLEDGKSETFPIEQSDVILIKESIISGLCRIVGIEHPLHKYLADNLVMSEAGDDDLGMPITSYKFKDVEETEVKPQQS